MFTIVVKEANRIYPIS